MAETGIRASEGVAIDVTDLNLDRAQLRVMEDGAPGYQEPCEPDELPDDHTDSAH